MPNNIVKSFAKKTGKSEKEVEKLWDQAKAIAAKEYPEAKGNDEKFFSIVTGILKKELGLKENFSELVDTELAKLDEAKKCKKKKKLTEEEDEEEDEEGEMEDEEEDEDEDKKKKKKDTKEMDESMNVFSLARLKTKIMAGTYNRKQIIDLIQSHYGVPYKAVSGYEDLLKLAKA